MTNNSVERFPDCERMLSVFNVQRDLQVNSADWDANDHQALKIMPPNGSWVRIIIENGNLSCAAKVFRRTTTKKATLLFWDEQDNSTKQCRHMNRNY